MELLWYQFSIVLMAFNNILFS